jgi:hypothetical protein
MAALFSFQIQSGVAASEFAVLIHPAQNSQPQ